MPDPESIWANPGPFTEACCCELIMAAEYPAVVINAVHSINRSLPFNVSLLETLIFDVDGTLYRQMPVRYSVLWRLMRAHVGRPARCLSTLHVLRAYRKAQEVLRASPPIWDDLSRRQVQLASEWTGVQAEVVTSYVARWMETEPLDLVARSLRKGLLEFLQAAKGRGLRLGIFSDYPPGPKLEAMGLTHFFDVVVSAQDPEVQQFKPHARGLEVTLRRLGIAKHRALYVGDRPEIDNVAASKAGIACAIIGRKRNAANRRGWIEVTDYHELQSIICRQ